MYVKVKYFLAIAHHKKKIFFNKCIFSAFAQTQFKFMFQSIFKRSKVYSCCFINLFLISIMILAANNYENKIIEIKLFCAKLRFTLMRSFCLVLISSRCTFAASLRHFSLSCRSATTTTTLTVQNLLHGDMCTARQCHQFIYSPQIIPRSLQPNYKGKKTNK